MKLRHPPHRALPFALALALLSAGCSGGEAGAKESSKVTQVPEEPFEQGEAERKAELLAKYDTDIPLVRYAWDPQAGDPNVPADLGGPGFTGEGWLSNMEFPAQGSADAIAGGSFKMHILDWPATLRQAGKDWNTTFNYRARDVCFQGLLEIHPITLEFIPCLATHWWISEDKSTYRFRINPKARFNDGEEVTAEDVVASFDLQMDEKILFPSSQLVYGKFHRPKALSKYIVEVEAKEESWRNFMYFGASLAVFPAHQISIPGDEYLDKFQFEFTACTGPYEGRKEDVVMNQSIALVRNHDWWDEGNPAWVGLWNFERYEFDVVTENTLAFEKVKKGELDYFWVNKSQWWAEELLDDKIAAIDRGLLLKRKFFTDAPIGTSGTAINMTRPPLDDRRIRLALCHLENRELYNEKLFFDEYDLLCSYYQGGTYQNPNNEVVHYDELRAVELLEEAGWTELDSEGYRVKDGQRLSLDLIYRSKQSEMYLTIFQENCKKAGVEIELQQLTPAAHWKNLTGKDYELASTAWGALVFPNPETSFKSTLADEKHNNNVTGFKSERVDALLDEYDAEYDVARRIEIIREIDGLIFEQHPYILGWYSANQRVIFWNKFGMPDFGGLRTYDREEIMYSWWVDPELEAQLAKARKDASITMPKGEVENHFWEAWHLKHTVQSAQ